MPSVLETTDAIVMVDLTTICDSDVRILRGDVPAVAAGRVLGHEAIGGTTFAEANV
jgi:alcohol dehydrogenase